MKYRNRKTIKIYFVYTLVILRLYFFCPKEVYVKFTSRFKKKYQFRKSSSILSSLNVNAKFQEVYIKYTSNFEKKYINLEYLLPVYF